MWLDPTQKQQNSCQLNATRTITSTKCYIWFPAAGIEPPRHGESMPRGIKEAGVPNKTKIKRTTTPLSHRQQGF